MQSLRASIAIFVLLAACDNTTTSGNQTTSISQTASSPFSVRAILTQNEGCGSFAWRAVASDSGRLNARKVSFTLTDPKLAGSYLDPLSDGAFNGFTRQMHWTFFSGPGTRLIVWSFESVDYVVRDSATIC